VSIPSSISTLLVGILLTLASLWYGQNHGLMPAEASTEAVAIDGLFNFMLTISTGLFLLVQGIIVISVIRFRRKAGDLADGPSIHGNIPLEILWTAIPAVIVMGLSVYSFEVYNQIGGLNPMDHAMAHANSKQQMVTKPGAAIAAPLSDPDRPESVMPPVDTTRKAAPLADPNRSESVITPVDSTREVEGITSPSAIPSYSMPTGDPYEIQAMGLQYAWIFTYPDTGVVSGELHVPVGREILLNITAQDVLHAFWVPEFRLKQDAIPGRQTEIRFTPKTVGEYPVICAELCGPYHGAMKTKVIAHAPDDYAKWMDEQKVASAEGLNQAVAVANPDNQPAEFLAPHIQSFGINAQVLNQLHPMSEHQHPTAS
jgi:cytochrome c oxidase subunit 2